MVAQKYFINLKQLPIFHLSKLIDDIGENAKNMHVPDLLLVISIF